MNLSRWSAIAGTAVLTVSLHVNAATGADTPASTAAGAGTSGTAASNSTRLGTTPAATNDRIFYSIGVLLSQSIMGFNLSEHELHEIVKGLSDGVHQRADLQSARSAIPLIQGMQHTRQQAAGAAYLAKAALLPGAHKTSSGLLYVSTQTGTGPAPKLTDSVKVQYTGKLIDGTVFDSSDRHGGSATFPVGNIIPCWREALQLMKVGGEARVVCPSNLAYGDRGNRVIPPGATLDFQIKLLAIAPPSAPSVLPKPNTK
jgi:FKBP-type peptidyl-prolyl cis-trans isomerase FkpA